MYTVELMITSSLEVSERIDPSSIEHLKVSTDVRQTLIPHVGGTAGCVVASCLSEDHDVSVLVIEKGYVRDNIVSRMPLLGQNMFIGDILQVQGNRWSEPMSAANGRRSRPWAVEGLGGGYKYERDVVDTGLPWRLCCLVGNGP